MMGIEMHEIRFFTRVLAPVNNIHDGMIEIVVDDIEGIFNDLEMPIFEDVLLKAIKNNEISINQELIEILKDGYVLPYSEEYFGIDFVYEIPEHLVETTKHEALV